MPQALGVVGVGEDGSGLAPSGEILLRAVRPAADPSWGRVLATTVRLSATRRWRLVILVLAAVSGTVAGLWLAGVLTGAASPVARVPAEGTRPPQAAAAVRSRAATWIAGQVSGNAIIACDPDMCAALQARGVMAGRLMPLRTPSASPVGADVLVTSPSAGSRLAGDLAPAVIASFGSGDTRIEIRTADPGGPAAYQAALRADLAARRSAGSQLLSNRRLEFTVADAAQLRAGVVDARLLATLATLASQRSLRVIAFGDAAPGAPQLFRAVTVASSENGTAAITAAAALARAQAPPYLPAHVTFVHPDPGQTTLIIEFAAPSPLGLLTPVLR
jgi:hypothetical protein